MYHYTGRAHTAEVVLLLATQLPPFYLFPQGQKMMGVWPDARQR